MPKIVCRQADVGDAGVLAGLRGVDPGEQEYWRKRIAGYLLGELHPQKALKERAIFLAATANLTVGFVAGHLTHRYKCDGELQWINVRPEYQRTGIASQLLCRLADWFTEQNASRVCVDVKPENTTARSFYRRRGATDLNEHWLVWQDIKLVRSSRG
jgi:ribosomal protein S18 acetylase RimI-like enzyme